ncbi:MAG: M48 family metallopeptidase [Anaerohalosphaeraceae bacterium]|nr:M48 family metallopeptidase [Anaerohalosphaeraceae bacterium]
MWEQIRANKRNSILLLMLMAVVLGALGFVLGMAFVRHPAGGLFGVAGALVLWLILASISFSSGDQIFLAASKAVPVTKKVHPQLFNVVEEMSIASGLPMPKVYIINDPAPNAFATGRSPESASVAVTAGLLGKLNRDELQGVIAHEMAHILHRDILFVTIAGVMLGAIALMSQVFLRGMFYRSMMGGSRRRYSSNSSGGGQAQLVMLVIAIACAILAPIMASLLYFALSRRREYLADAGGARLTRYPEGLASALEKISQNTIPLESANKVTAPMYIANPLQKKGMKLSNLSSTHPPISERVKILRGMGGASLTDYSQAYQKFSSHKSSLTSVTALKSDEPVALRQGSAAGFVGRKKQARNVGDIMRKVNKYKFINCDCELKMKVPPDFKANAVKCPRCKTVHKVK